ncbi:Inward rectifier potassium channel Kirbac3.1 [Emticicia aquatica]|uniref:Inward rectifier potassium channel Kirbac3.1 n=1 Tax=Emticicia aquatica TaxID=1681835 RepID=A0ABM9AU52_9BACT|nr:ion channel [Emticicia aquatica]CAH0997565.1 Inward rectifier potassium channel Kirbac3.1 [Emticicia aquatica]
MQKKNTLVEKERNRQDLGFGTKMTDRRTRLITKNGQFNVKRVGQSFDAWLNTYNRLITISWIKFFFLVLFVYLLLNLSFAYLYYLIGVEHLAGVDMTNTHSQFWDAFFFSAQSLTTVGYGRIAPIGFAASFVAGLESLAGLMMFAIITGLLYGRFSRPNPRILFSKNALIAPYLDTNALMFRMVNEKSNQIINMEVSLVFSKVEEKNGVRNRQYYGLTLERSKVNFFPTNWTIVHAITEDSPFYGETPETLAAADAEFMIATQGIDDTFADAVHKRHSYFHDELVWGGKFKPMLENDGEESYILDLRKIHDYDLVALN